MHRCQIQLVITLVQLRLVVANHPFQALVDHFLFCLPRRILRTISFPFHLVRHYTADLLDSLWLCLSKPRGCNDGRISRASRGMLPRTDSSTRMRGFRLVDNVTLRLHTLLGLRVHLLLQFDRHFCCDSEWADGQGSKWMREAL